MNDGSSISHIADTALWVATYRALESERPDALFHDKLAGLLSGDRGKRIAAAMPYPKIMAWALVMRTLAIDELIRHAIALGVDTIINLGAGLDTRPYRMELPPSLRWIEVDFPQMISYKREKLANERPVCRLEQIAADLSDLPSRKAMFQRLGSESRKALIITEGVVTYLTAHDAELLSRDLLAVPTFLYWIQDYFQGGKKRWSPRSMRKRLKESPFQFDEVDWLAFFEKHGWTILENRLAADEADRVKRPFPVPFPWGLIVHVLPEKIKERGRRSSGYVMFQKPVSAK